MPVFNPTLSTAANLEAFGLLYTHLGNGKTDIVEASGRVVFTGTVSQVNDWLRAGGPETLWLSVRLISRLSPLRRANLERRITEHVERLESEHCDGSCYDKGEPCGDRLMRNTQVLGRCMMLISNAELRERSARHG